jgi:hypothetical protein
LKREEEIRNFDKLVPKASRLHRETWCVKRQDVMPTLELKGEECCKCDDFVLRNGVCDPL